jgi:hypothetical protein
LAGSLALATHLIYGSCASIAWGNAAGSMAELELRENGSVVSALTT